MILGLNDNWMPSTPVTYTPGASAADRPQPPAPTPSPAPSVGQDAGPQPSLDELQQAVKKVNEAVQSRNTEIEFAIDDKSSRLITKVVNTNTGEVIRQMPSQEVLRIANAIADRLNKQEKSTVPPLVKTSA